MRWSLRKARGSPFRPLSKLVDLVERSAYFFMFQAVAFAAGLTDLTGDRWLETLRELYNEIVSSVVRLID